MTLDPEQRDVAARILAQLTPLEPSKRPAVLALVVQALVRCGAPVGETTSREATG